MKTLLLSIIVPIYNTDSYLAPCIDSILAQKLSEYELLLIDDGSVDNSGCICDEYVKKDKHIKTIHTVNQGVSMARNLGLDIAQGQYITFVDSDDRLLERNTYQQLLELLISHPTIDIIQYPYEKIEHEQTVQYVIPDNEELLISKQKFIEKLDSTSNGPLNNVIWNKIYKKELFNKIRFTRNCVFEDTSCLIDLFKQTNTIYISQKGRYGYYQREGSITHSMMSPKMYSDNLSTHLKVFLFLKEQAPNAIWLQTDKYINVLSRYINAACSYPDFKLEGLIETLNKHMPRKYVGNSKTKLKIFLMHRFGFKKYVKLSISVKRIVQNLNKNIPIQKTRAKII